MKFYMQNLACWCILSASVNEIRSSRPITGGIVPNKIIRACTYPRAILSSEFYAYGIKMDETNYKLS